MRVYKNNFEIEEDINIFGSCENALRKMVEESIFDIYFNEDNSEFIILEKCDEYFGTKLTKELCVDLSNLFLKIANKIDK